MACPIYYLDLMGIGDGSRAVPLPMSLACSSPVMHVATKVACGGQSDYDSSSAVDFDGWIESEGEKKKGRYMSFGL